MSERVRPEGYYWVLWREEAEPSIAKWGPMLSHHPTPNPSWVWTNEQGPDYDSSDGTDVRVLLGPLHLHCYNRSCLRGSPAFGRTTVEEHPETFRPAGCECDCVGCDVARSLAAEHP